MIAGQYDNASPQTARQRRSTVAQLIRTAAARDAEAHARDVAAAARDQIADLRDRELAARDAARADERGAMTGAEVVLRAAEDRRLAARDRSEAAATRIQAAEDRRIAALDRENAARDRLHAQAVRGILLAELDIAETDALTGARTRAAGLVDLDQELERARRTTCRLVVAYVRVVERAPAFDELDAAQRDEALCTVVHAIRSRLRSYDLIVRLAEHEFLCAMSGATRHEARNRFRAISAALADRLPPARIEMGFATFAPEDDSDTLLRRADAELPAERHAGG